MTDRIARICLLSACFVILIGALYGRYFYTTDYLPSMKKINELQQELEKVKEARRAWEEAVRRGNGEASYPVRFNYLTEQGISGASVTPMVLKDINTWIESNNLGFAGLHAENIRQQENLDIMPYVMNGYGSFMAITVAMRWMEEKKRAVITGFRIGDAAMDVHSNGPRAVFDPLMIPFELSWEWLESAPKRLHSVAMPNEELTNAPRDAFKPYQPPLSHNADKGRNRIVWEPAPASIKLQGLTRLKQGYGAIINNRYLCPGGLVDGYTVLSVDRSSVILGKGNIRCRLSMKDVK